MVSPPLDSAAGRGAFVSSGVIGATMAEEVVVRGGVCDRFLRRPAIWGGSGRRSGGGEPDMGGVGRDAQMGGAIGFGSVKCSMVNLEELMLERCFLKDEQREN